MPEPRSSPTCALCDVQGHVTQNSLDLPILRTHMWIVVETDDTPIVNIPTIPKVKKTSL